MDGAIMRRPSNQWQGDECEMSKLATKRFTFGDVPHTEESREILHDVLVTVERLASIGGWTWDRVNDQLLWSEEVSRIFRRDLQSFPATIDNFLSVVHPDDLQRVQTAVAATFEHNAPYDIAFRIVRPDGTERVIHAQGESTLDQAGKVVRLTGTAHDITEREEAERRAREDLQRTQTQLEIIGQIGQSEALMSGDIEAIAAEITELASFATGCERVNVWLFNDAETELHCIDLYEATPALHSSGMILSDKDFGDEIAAVKASRYVAADDALSDPRTKGYVEPYLRPLGITSMLDAVIQASGQHFGLLCFEHVDKAHSWTRDEISFACQLADKVGIAVISLKRRQAEAALRRREALLHTVAVSASELVSASKLDEALPKALELMSRTLQIDRMTVLERPKSVTEAPVLRYIWQSEDVKFRLDKEYFEDPGLMSPAIVEWTAPLYEGR
ncbi:MAG TPA: PAS domain-containing protein, partial [Aestuariivirgaceae bacterium]|nr:PAS domain-containing protein [Aestuariivirgaceae bacterium]